MGKQKQLHKVLTTKAKDIELEQTDMKPHAILVTFRGQNEYRVFTKDMLGLLKTAPNTMQILDGETGEQLYYKKELPGN